MPDRDRYHATEKQQRLYWYIPSLDGDDWDQFFEEDMTKTQVEARRRIIIDTLHNNEAVEIMEMETGQIGLTVQEE